MAKSPIIGGFSRQRSSQAADNDTINLAVEVIETKDGKVNAFMFIQSGLDLMGTVGNGPIRGVLDLKDILYVVSGPEVWSVTPNGILTLLSTPDNQLSDVTTPVSMFENNRQLMIVDGVGAWLVPGGYPLTNGAIKDGGALYKVADTITLLGATGDQTSYPVIEVTSISSGSVHTFRIINDGTGYSNALAVATTPYQPQPGSGTGFTIDITSIGTGAQITGSSVNAIGAGYNPGDTGIVQTGGNNAVYQVLTTSGGGVLTYQFLNPGTGYVVGTNVATTFNNGITPCAGLGFKVNTTTTGGAVTLATLSSAGRGYAVGNAGFINGGGSDATFLIDAVGASGEVTGFRFIQGGAINDKALTFTQKSTTGAGSGFVLDTPVYDAFLSLVPVTVPFDRPISGGVSDGFGLLVFEGRQEIAQSDELDLSTWDPLNFGVADQSPDNCIGLVVIHNQVYVGKQKNTEIWVDQGNAGFSFGPVTSVHMEEGWMSPYAASKIGEELVFLSRNDEGQGQVMLASGYRTEPVSTQALVDEFLSYPNIGDAFSYARQEGQHVYYVLTFPQANKTWCYDRTASKLSGTPIWTRLAAFENGEFNRHWGNCYVPWDGTVRITETITSYQPLSVKMVQPTELDTSGALSGLTNPYAAAVFSIWLYLPDNDVAGFKLSNQVNSGLEITIQNDASGTPQIIIEAYDTSNSLIVSAAYNYTQWDQWVNFLISIDTATNQLQVYANAIIAGVFTETHLTPLGVSWSSTNAIGNPHGVPWRVQAIEGA